VPAQSGNGADGGGETFSIDTTPICLSDLGYPH
jgi:hypothetical protein